MDLEEILAAVAAGIVAGLLLATVEKLFPSAGIGRV